MLFAMCLFYLSGCKTEITGREMPDAPTPSFSGIELQSLQAIDIAKVGITNGNLALKNIGEITYSISVPSISDGDSVPLILALHYANGDGVSYLSESIEPALVGLNGIIIAPSAINKENWSSQSSTKMVKELLDYAIAHWPVDPNKVVVTGYSMGGFGTWSQISQYPELFSAAIPMAASPKDWIDQITVEVPVYIIHPEFDTVSSLEVIEHEVSTLRELGVDVQLHVMTAANHADWDFSESYLNDATDWLEYSVWLGL